MTEQQIVGALRALIAQAQAEQAALVASTGVKVQDGHSDGRRVKYVRAETAEATLKGILALLEGGSK